MIDPALRVFVFRPLKKTEVDELNDFNKEFSVISTNDNFTDGLITKSSLVSQDDFQRHETKAKDLIQNFGYRNFNFSGSLVDRTTFNGILLWHPVRFGIYHKFGKLLVQKNIIDEYLNDLHSYVRIYTNEPSIERLYKSFDVRIIEESTPKTKIISAPKFVVLFLLRALIGLLRNGFPAKGKRVILNTISPLVPFIDVLGKNKVMGLPHVDYFLQLVSKDPAFAVVASMKFAGIRDGLFPMGEILFSSYPKGKVYHFESFVLMSLLNWKSVRQLRLFWNTLEISISKEYSELDQILLADFKKRKLQFFHAAILALGGLRMIRKMSPLCVGGDNEHSFVKRPVIGAAKVKGIPTFAIQHGDIHRNNFNYRFTNADPLGQLLPDLTCVWGESIRDYLVENSCYQHDSIFVVGQIRTDVIPALIARYAKKIGNREFTILFASQPFFNQELRQRMYVDVIKAAKELPNVKFIHKPHQRETNWSFFDDLDEANDYKFERTNQDLYLLLAQADLVITGFSTVGVEAVYFDKDLIVLDYLKEDIAGYVKDNVALQATCSQDLVQFIKLLSSGEKLLKADMKKDYVMKRTHKIDGQASKRLKEKIEAI